MDANVTHIAGGNNTEYVSPSLVLLQDSQGNKVLHENTSDWFAEVCYMNPGMFDSNVSHQLHKIKPESIAEMPEGSEKAKLEAIQKDANEDGFDMYKVAFRCHTDDYQKIMQNINSEVLAPLRNNLINIKENPVWQVNMQPDVGHVPIGDNGSSLWKQYNSTASAVEGRAAVTMECTLKFLNR